MKTLHCTRQTAVPEAPPAQPDRRELLRRCLGLGALLGVSGCDVTQRDSTQRLLRGMSRSNDRAQAALFRSHVMAAQYPDSALTQPFRFNAFYTQASVPVIDGQHWQLAVTGQVRDTRPWRLDAIKALPAITQSTRLVCIEGWSAVGKWTGVPLHVFLAQVGADVHARYVGLRCADGYFTSIDMASALHPQTMLAYGFGGADALPEEFGHPLRLRIPTKLGFKNPKHLIELFVTDQFPGGYWEDLHGYNWFAGL